MRQHFIFWFNPPGPPCLYRCIHLKCYFWTRFETVTKEIKAAIGQEEIEWVPEMKAKTADLKVGLIAEHDQDLIVGARVTVKCVNPHLNKTSDVGEAGMYLLEDAIPVVGDHGCKVTAVKFGCVSMANPNFPYKTNITTYYLNYFPLSDM